MSRAAIAFDLDQEIEARLWSVKSTATEWIEGLEEHECPICGEVSIFRECVDCMEDDI